LLMLVLIVMAVIALGFVAMKFKLWYMKSHTVIK
jgi:hypothetical protein